MSSNTLEIFRNRLTLDLAHPPLKRVDWGLDRLAHNYSDMDQVLSTVTENISPYIVSDGNQPFPKAFLIEFNGRASLISSLGDRLRTGIVAVPLAEDANNHPMPVIDDGLKNIFASMRANRGLNPRDPLDAVLVEDIVATGDSAFSLAVYLWHWDKIRIVHVSSLIEDLRKNGREHINNPIIQDGVRLDGRSYSTAVRFDPNVGFIEGLSTEGVKLEENRGLSAGATGGEIANDSERFKRVAEIINESNFGNDARILKFSANRYQRLSL